MGDLQAVIGPHIASHPEAAYLFGLISALEDGSIDARIAVISALLCPPEPTTKLPVGGFL